MSGVPHATTPRGCASAVSAALLLPRCLSCQCHSSRQQESLHKPAHTRVSGTPSHSLGACVQGRAFMWGLTGVSCVQPSERGPSGIKLAQLGNGEGGDCQVVSNGGHNALVLHVNLLGLFAGARAMSEPLLATISSNIPRCGRQSVVKVSSTPKYLNGSFGEVHLRGQPCMRN